MNAADIDDIAHKIAEFAMLQKENVSIYSAVRNETIALLEPHKTPKRHTDRTKELANLLSGNPWIAQPLRESMDYLLRRWDEEDKKAAEQPVTT